MSNNKENRKTQRSTAETKLIGVVVRIVVEKKLFIFTPMSLGSELEAAKPLVLQSTSDIV